MIRPSNYLVRSARRRAQFAVAAFAAAALIGVSACSSGGSSSQASSGSSSGSSSSQNLQTISIAIPAAIVDYVDLYIAEQQGFFKAQGLNVPITIAGGNLVNSLVSGQVDLINYNMGGMIAPSLQGKPTTIIYGGEAGATSGIGWGRTGVNSLSDCKRVGTNPQGSGPNTWANIYKGLLGANYTVVPFTTPTAMLAALAAGSIDCSVFAYPGVASLVDNGTIHCILNPTGIPALPKTPVPAGITTNFVGGGYAGLSSTIKADSASMVKFLKAIRQADKYIESTPAATVAADLLTLNDFKTNKAQDLTNSVKVEDADLAPDSGYITSAAWTNTLAYNAKGGSIPSATNPIVSYSNRVDMSYLTQATGGQG
jgi:ABC-type nitrate/sulfonate/bicarbonate transport system substrate-binding protein